MLNQIILFLLFILTLNNTGLCDSNTSYCLKATIIMKNGIIYRGYYSLQNLSIGKDNIGYYYSEDYHIMRLQTAGRTSISAGIKINKTDYHFNTFIKHLGSDTIRLFSSIAIVTFIDRSYQNSIIKELSKGIGIATRDVKEIVVHELYNNSYYFIESKCIVNDSSWISQRVIKREFLGGVEACSYYALIFKNNHEKITPILRELKALYIKYSEIRPDKPKKDFDRIQKFIDDKIETLRQEFVLVQSYCSC